MASVTVDLDEAQRTGLISPGQAEELRRSSNPTVHDEPIQVTNRFSEIFVAIGCAILLQGSLAVMVGQEVPRLHASMVQVGLAWALAELLHWRRMGFATGFCVVLMAWAVAGVATAATMTVVPKVPHPGFSGFPGVRTVSDASVILAATAAAFGAGLARFRIPFLVFPTGAFAAGSLAYYLYAKGQIGSLPVLAAVGVVGAALLALGIWADGKDPERKGKPSQYAFWLFVVGSPLTVHPFLILCLSQLKGVPPGFVASLVILLSLAVTLLGLVLDRRGPVVSTLLYVTVAVGYILKSPGTATLLIGLYVLALGLLWKPTQAKVSEVLGRGRRAMRADVQPTGGLKF